MAELKSEDDFKNQEQADGYVRRRFTMWIVWTMFMFAIVIFFCFFMYKFFTIEKLQNEMIELIKSNLVPILFYGVSAAGLTWMVKAK